MDQEQKQPSETPTLGSRIRELLKERRWSQSELAKRVGIERSHLGRLLRGERTWKPEQVERIAGALEKTAEELVEGTDAQGLFVARDVARARANELGEELAEAYSRLSAVEATNKALRLELDRRLSPEKSQAIQRELATQRGESQKLREQLAAERGAREAAESRESAVREQLYRAQMELHEARRIHQAQVAQLTTDLDEANRRTVHNANLSRYWEAQAEERGATLKAGLATAAIVGLVAAVGVGAS